MGEQTAQLISPRSTLGHDHPWYLLEHDGVAPDVGFGPALLRLVAEAGTGAYLHLYQPRPTVAFGGSDRRNPGFGEAMAAARAHGFEPLVRAPGGHAVAYHEQSVCLEFIAADPDPHEGTMARFYEFGGIFIAALRTLGVEAGLGAVVDEYCRGDHSVNHAGRSKLIGTAQRLTRGGWMFGAGIVIADPDPVRAVLVDVYRALGLPFDPGSVGTLAEITPRHRVEDFTTALLTTLAQRIDILPAPWPLSPNHTSIERGSHE